MVVLHGLMETVRGLLGAVPLPLWLSAGALAGLIAYFIEQRAITRIIVWGIIAVLLWVVIYFL